jgi:hypothetical protein
MKRGKKDLNRLIWSQQNGTFYLDMHIYGPVGNWIKINGMCYLFSGQKLQWQEAISECQKYGNDATSLQFYSKQDKVDIDMHI